MRPSDLIDKQVKVVLTRSSGALVRLNGKVGIAAGLDCTCCDDPYIIVTINGCRELVKYSELQLAKSSSLNCECDRCSK